MVVMCYCLDSLSYEFSRQHYVIKEGAVFLYEFMFLADLLEPKVKFPANFPEVEVVS